jgi:hypothetical protein
MLVRSSTYNKVKQERDELLLKLERLEELEVFFEDTKHRVEAYLTIAEDLKERFSHLDLSELHDSFKAMEVSSTSEDSDNIKQDLVDPEGVKKLEDKMANIPNNASGSGGIEIVENGEKVLRRFASKNELNTILKEAKTGKIKIAYQDWS